MKHLIPFLLLLTLASGSQPAALAAPPPDAPAAQPSSVPPEIATALAACESDRAAMAAAGAKLASDVAALQTLIAKTYAQTTPTPIPVPVPTHKIEILEIGATTCGPCNTMSAILKTLQAEGIPIRRIDTDVAKDVAEAEAYAVKATPTFVTLVDGREVNRAVGVLDAGQLRGWFKSTQEWAAKLKGEQP